jgi:hypothetical protein
MASSVCCFDSGAVAARSGHGVLPGPHRGLEDAIPPGEWRWLVVLVRVCVYVCRTKFVGAEIFVCLCCCCCQTQEATTLGGVRWLQMQSASDLVR